MTPVATGPSTSRVTRGTVLFALTIGFSAAFLYDGHYGYAADNVRQFLQSIGESAERVATDPALTTARGKEIAAQFRAGDPVASVEALLGRPHLEAPATSYYFSRGGRIELRREANRIRELGWFDFPHSEMDQTWQRWIGYILVAVGVVFLIRLVRALTDRVLADDSGLRVGRSEFIALSNIIGIDTDRLESDGLAIVTYVSRGRRRSLQLDAVDYKNLPVVLDSLRWRVHPSVPDGTLPPVSDAPALSHSKVSGV